MDAILFIVGIVMLIKGNIQATSHSEISKTAGRVLGILLLLPGLNAFLYGFLSKQQGVTFWNTLNQPWVESEIFPLGVDLQSALLVLAFVAILITILFFRKPIGIVPSPTPSTLL